MNELAKFIPEHTSSYLFGGITLDDFSPGWSDVDIIVWVNQPQVTEDLINRSFTLWKRMEMMPHGPQIYLYIAPQSVVSGPMNDAGGGISGQPQSIRVYRSKWRDMEGYPLSLPDTVCLVRHGIRLTGEEIKPKLPKIPLNWEDRYLQIQLLELVRLVSQGRGPFGDDSEAAVQTWGPEGMMSHPLWFARQLYSHATKGEVASKGRAIECYLENHSTGSLASSLRIIKKWRDSGTVDHRSEVLEVAQRMKECTVEFLQHVAVMKSVKPEVMPKRLDEALEFMVRYMQLCG